MRYAIINTNTNIVENVVEYDNIPINPPPGFENNYIAIDSDIANPGWEYKNNQFIDPTPPLSYSHIPQQAPMWAIRTVLQNDGYFDQIQSMITASTDIALKNVWEYGNFADRNSKFILSILRAFGLTDEQVDQMFVDANNLNV